MEPNTPRYRIKNLSMYDGHTVFLDDINFEINENEFITILGNAYRHNKTLLSILAKKEKGYDGEIVTPHRTNNKDIKSEYVTCEKGIFNTSKKAGAFFGKFNSFFRFQYHNEKNRTILTRLNLENSVKTRVYHLNDNYQQLLKLAIGISKSPDLLVINDDDGLLERALKQELSIPITAVSDIFGIPTIAILSLSKQRPYGNNRVLILDYATQQYFGTHPSVLKNKQANSNPLYKAHDQDAPSQFKTGQMEKPTSAGCC